MKLILTGIALFIAGTTQAQDFRPEIYCEHFFYGYPYGTPASNDLIIRDIYALSNNDSTRFADWVAYRLTMHEVDGDLTVERAWKSDPWLDEDETLENSPDDDYLRANRRIKTDRGHQAPLASFKGSRHAAHTNYLSNITPQKSDLNQGPWSRLEEKVRNIVRQGQVIYVMTGPLYERSMEALPRSDEPHIVPSGYWKIIGMERSGNISIVGFIFDQETPRSDALLSHLAAIDEIEQRSGLDFLWLLDDQLENSLESNINMTFANGYFAE
jgi:endonuclease G